MSVGGANALSLPLEGARSSLREEFTHRDNSEPAPRPVSAHRAREARREARVEVAALVTIVSSAGPQLVRLSGLSAKTAEVIAPKSLGLVGECVDVHLPVLGGRELEVPAGIVSTERLGEDERVTLEFMIADVPVRRELNELLALLLAGETGSVALQPRVIYDAIAAYGPGGQQRGHLEELSLIGLSIRTNERIAHGACLSVAVPAYRTATTLLLEGRVTGQQLSPDGGYRTTVSFDGLSAKRRQELAELIADLMCR